MAETELDILITRVLDGRATATDWGVIERLADRDPSVWRELAWAQRDDRALRAVVSAAAASAERVDLHAAVLASEVRTSEDVMRRRTRLVATWAGWATAAAVALAFVTSRPVGGSRQLNPNIAGVGAPEEPIVTAADKLAEYLAKGREEGTVIQEVPEKWLISAQPTQDGARKQVIYLRLIMERTEVPDFYTFSQDEWGNPAPARVRLVEPQTAAPRAVPPV